MTQWLGTCRFVYNLALDHRITAYKSAKVSINYYDQAGELKHLKKLEGYEWIKQVQSQVLQDVLKRVDRSFQNFFRGSGFPNWAKRGQYNSFTFPQLLCFQIKNKRVKLPKLGELKICCHRPLKGKVKQCHVIQELNKWYICIVCEQEQIKAKSKNQAIGIDLGIARLATLSDGTYFDNTKFYNSHKAKLRVKQRKLSRQKKFGSNWFKTLKQLKALHYKIRNCRKDYLHRVSFAITSKYDMVIVEDLHLKGMTKSAKGTMDQPGKNVKAKSGLNRSLRDSGLGILSKQLEYKTIHQGGQFKKVNPAYTSQRCSRCGHISKFNRLTQSHFKCMACSFACNADENAAKNILASGTEALSLTWDMVRA